MPEHPTHHTTTAHVAIYEVMVPQIDRLIEDIAPRALKAPDGLASSASVAAINRVLAQVLRITSRLPAGGLVALLPEDGSVTHPDLVISLSLAQTALTLFRRKSGLRDIDGSWAWLTTDA